MPTGNPTIVRVLNDLLQLDQDAIRSYQIAIDALSSEALKQRVRVFKRDHQRHVKAISALIEEHGGTPLKMPHLSTGFLKLAVQSLGAAGGDRAVLLAFRANEWESAHKYRRAAARRFTPPVREVIRRGAADEEKHYRWASEALERLGAGDETVLGRVEQVIERLHGGAALGLEALESMSVAAVTGRGHAGKKAASKAQRRPKGSGGRSSGGGPH